MKTILVAAGIVVSSAISVYGLIALDGLGLIQHDTAVKTVVNIYNTLYYVLPVLAVVVVATLVRARSTRS